MKTKNLALIVAITVSCLCLPLFSLASEQRAPEIKVFDTLSGRPKSDFLAYSNLFGGGAAVAVGDISGDSRAEIVTASGLGGNTHVRGFTSEGRFNGLSFFPFHPDYRGGGDIAVGDIDGNGKDEIIVSARTQSQSRIKVYDGGGQVMAEFLAFSPEFKGGAYVTAGDINGNGRAEIIVGAGVGGNPHVRVFDGRGNYLGLDFFPFPFEFKGGVDVGAADFDGDGRADIVAGAAASGQARVRVYKADSSQRIIGDFLAFNGDYKDGVRVAGADIDGDGVAEVIAGASSNSVPEVKTFKTNGQPARFNKVVYENDFRGGIDVAGGHLSSDKRADVVSSPQKMLWEGRRDLWKYIDIDLTHNRLYVYEGGRKKLEAVTSAGRPGMATPTGEFKVMSKSERIWSGRYGLWMPYSLQFTSAGHFIHRLPEWPGGYVEGENHLGMNVSHGCVRVGYKEAGILYNMVEVGTPIIIHY
jgi:lipoprotein-anchoring transpeptidase ErfK/SrfK